MPVGSAKRLQQNLLNTHTHTHTHSLSLSLSLSLSHSLARSHARTHARTHARARCTCLCATPSQFEGCPNPILHVRAKDVAWLRSVIPTQFWISPTLPRISMKPHNSHFCLPTGNNFPDNCAMWVASGEPGDCEIRGMGY